MTPTTTPAARDGASDAELDALIARVERATGPDRALMIECARFVVGPYEGGSTVERSDWWNRFYRFIDAEAWESAALSLVERVLPGWGVEVLTPDRAMWRARVWAWGSETTDEAGQWLSCYAPTPALALILAMLRAIKEQRHGG